MRFGTYQAVIFKHINCKKSCIYPWREITFLYDPIYQLFSITDITSVVLGVTSHPCIFSGFFAAILSPSASCLWLTNQSWQSLFKVAFPLIHLKEQQCTDASYALLLLASRRQKSSLTQLEQRNHCRRRLLHVWLMCDHVVRPWPMAKPLLRQCLGLFLHFHLVTS